MFNILVLFLAPNRLHAQGFWALRGVLSPALLGSISRDGCYRPRPAPNLSLPTTLPQYQDSKILGEVYTLSYYTFIIDIDIAFLS
jgi:hypothetical protein